MALGEFHDPSQFPTLLLSPCRFRTGGKKPNKKVQIRDGLTVAWHRRRRSSWSRVPPGRRFQSSRFGSDPPLFARRRRRSSSIYRPHLPSLLLQPSLRQTIKDAGPAGFFASPPNPCSQPTVRPISCNLTPQFPSKKKNNWIYTIKRSKL